MGVSPTSIEVIVRLLDRGVGDDGFWNCLLPE